MKLYCTLISCLIAISAIFYLLGAKQKAREQQVNFEREPDRLVLHKNRLRKKKFGKESIFAFAVCVCVYVHVFRWSVIAAEKNGNCLKGRLHNVGLELFRH
jgi:hypothetical protein